MTDKQTPTTFKPMRPYLFKAFYQWIIDNQMTPLVEVDTSIKGVSVPLEYIKNNRIVLNIAMYATHLLHIDDDAVSFSARFNGVSRDLYVPMAAILNISARENQLVFPFDPNEYTVDESGVASAADEETLDDIDPVEEKSEPARRKSSLRLVKDE